MRRLHEGRDPAIDFLRGWAIFVVIALHFAMVYAPKVPVDTKIFSLRFWPFLFRNGYFGVSAFFVISGFLITSGALKKYSQLKRISLYDFYVFRFARIVPPLLFLVAVNVVCDLFISSPTFGLHGDMSFFDWLLVFTVKTPEGFFEGKHPEAGFSLGVTWSLLIEEGFYFGFPLLMLTLRRHSLIALSLVGFFVGGMLYRNEYGYPSYFSYLGCFDLLALGCLVAMACHHFPRVVAKLQSRWLALVGFGLTACVYVSHLDREIPVFGPTLIGTGVAIFILSTRTSFESKKFDGSFSRLFRTMGLLSYEFYMMHIVVAQLLTVLVFNWLDANEPLLAGAYDVYFLMTWLTTFVVSYAMSEFYSEPARRLTKRAFFSLRDRFRRTGALAHSASDSFKDAA